MNRAEGEYHADDSEHDIYRTFQLFVFHESDNQEVEDIAKHQSRDKPAWTVDRHRVRLREQSALYAQNTYNERLQGIS